jgi:hypothetical protein
MKNIVGAGQEKAIQILAHTVPSLWNSGLISVENKETIIAETSNKPFRNICLKWMKDWKLPSSTLSTVTLQATAAVISELLLKITCALSKSRYIL